VRRMLATEFAVLLKLKPLRYCLFILCRRVIPALAICAGKSDYITHDLPFL